MPSQTIHFSAPEISDPTATISTGGALQPPLLTAQSTRASAVKTLSREQESYFASQTLRKRISRSPFVLKAWALRFLSRPRPLLGFHLHLPRISKREGLP